MLLAVVASLASAGDLYTVQFVEGGIAYELVDTTKTGDGAIVTYPDQAVDMVVVADLSSSITHDEAYAMGDTIEAFHEALLAHGQPRDRFGVTAFAGRAQRWIPLGRVDRPDLDEWTRRFGPARASFDEPRSYGADPDAAAVPPDPRSIDPSETDAASGLDAAIDELGKRRGSSLQVIVLLWDGGHNGWGDLGRALDRAWADGIHVWSLSFARPEGPLVTRGGGDAYVVRTAGPFVAERIVKELSFEP